MLLQNTFHVAIFFLLSSKTFAFQSNIKRFDLTIKSAFINPDCHNQSYAGLLVNDQYPGPTLHLVKNDIVEIRVKNDAGNNVSTSIHFHGIRQLNTNHADGVASITQLAVAPGQEFIQKFQVTDQSGTFYYHAHVGVQDDTVQGAFIVHDSEEARAEITHSGPFPYDAELILHWAEWWHQSIYDRERYYLSPQYTVDAGPDSLLLNGHSIYNIKSVPSNCRGFAYFDVEPNKTYRLRIIGALTHRAIGMFIKDHNMSLIEIDGEYVHPLQIESLELHAGQRMSVLVKTGNYSAGTIFPIATDYRWRRPLPDYVPSGFGYIRYVNPDQPQQEVRILNTPGKQDLPAYNSSKGSIPGWVLPEVRPYVSGNNDILEAVADHTIVLNMKETKMLDNTTRFVLNGRPYIEHPWGNATASLYDLVTSNPDPGELYSDGASEKHHTYPISQGKIVDLIFQNTRLPRSGGCNPHPWHTHGYSHYLVAEGPGEYIHERDKGIKTYPNPIYRDVSVVYPRIQEGVTGCGWTKVRIYTDNPGVWAVHCHITSHMLQGKMAVLEVAGDLIVATRREF